MSLPLTPGLSPSLTSLGVSTSYLTEGTGTGNGTGSPTGPEGTTVLSTDDSLKREDLCNLHCIVFLLSKKVCVIGLRCPQSFLCLHRPLSPSGESQFGLSGLLSRFGTRPSTTLNTGGPEPVHV